MLYAKVKFLKRQKLKKKKPSENTRNKTSVVMHTFNLSTQDAEAGGQPGLYSEFQTSQNNMVRSCLKKVNFLKYTRNKLYKSF